MRVTLPRMQHPDDKDVIPDDLVGQHISIMLYQKQPHIARARRNTQKRKKAKEIGALLDLADNSAGRCWVTFLEIRFNFSKVVQRVIGKRDIIRHISKRMRQPLLGLPG